MVLPFLLNIHFLSILPYVLTLLAIAIFIGAKVLGDAVVASGSFPEKIYGVSVILKTGRA
jgi:hypothetical protein